MVSSKDHVYGPYKHRNRWRIEFVTGDGRRSRASFATEREAVEAANTLRAKLAGRKVIDAVNEYLADMSERGARDSSVKTVRHRLGTMLECGAELTGGPLDSVTPARARVLFENLAVKTYVVKNGPPVLRPRSVNYRAGVLVDTRMFMAFCVRRGYLRRDPFEGIEVKGRRKKGKPQLHVSEAQRWTDAALVEIQKPGPIGDAALAAVLALLLGARATEVATRERRDVDQDGAVLWIPISKTEAGRRRCGIPAFLRPLVLERLARLGGPTDPLFPGVERHRVLRAVHRICEAAGVMRVCTQSLRGLHGTLAIEAGATAEMVAHQLGHASTDVTTGGSYVKRSALDTAAQGRVLTLVRGGKS